MEKGISTSAEEIILLTVTLMRAVLSVVSSFAVIVVRYGNVPASFTL